MNLNLEESAQLVKEGMEIESLDRSVQEVARTLHRNPTSVAMAYHKLNVTNRLTDFYGSPHIPIYIQRLYDWLAFQIPEYTIEINRKRKLKNNRTAYLQIYIVEKRLAILVDFDLSPELYSRMSILKLNRRDFEDPILLSKTKTKIMKTLKKPFKMYNKNMFFKDEDIFTYIEKAKSMNEEQYRNKLYFDMINKSFNDDREKLDTITDNLSNFGFRSTTILNIKQEVNDTTRKLKNIISFFDE